MHEGNIVLSLFPVVLESCQLLDVKSNYKVYNQLQVFIILVTEAETFSLELEILNCICKYKKLCMQTLSGMSYPHLKDSWQFNGFEYLSTVLIYIGVFEKIPNK